MDKAVDILHPLASLEWRECRGPPLQPVSGGPRLQAVCVKDKVYYIYITRPTAAADARLYIYTPSSDTWDTMDTPVYGLALTTYHTPFSDTWDTMDTPVYGLALTTYHSQLVLVGGKEYPSGLVQLFTLSEDGQWQETIPPLKLVSGYNVSATSHGDHLLVLAYGHLLNLPNKLSVFNGHHWTSSNHAPLGLAVNVCFTVANGHWYLFGSPTHLGETKVYSVSLDSLIASCQPSEVPLSSPVWTKLPDVPDQSCSVAVLGNRLVVVGSRAIFAYSSITHSWVEVDNYQGGIHGLHVLPCAIVLPSNELMVFGSNKTYKVRLVMTPFNQDSEFNKRTLSLLEEVGIPVLSSLRSHANVIKETLGFAPHPVYSLDTLLHVWLGGGGNVGPTWKNLLSLIRQLHLDDIAHQVETCLCGATVEQHHKEVGEKEIVLAKEGCSDLESQLLRSQPPIKEEVEEKPVALVPIETKCKEEVVTDTKMSAQPSAVWDLRGVEVCGEMSVVVNSSHAQQIKWKGFGLKLTIHEGSLPADVQQCVITIKASLAGQYEFPEKSHLVSAVFWLRCEPMCKFAKPITVEIQHCARSENVASLNLKFVRAVCSQKELPYTFKQLRGNFTSHSSYGVIELDSFSGLAITQEGSEDREYCSQFFYLGQRDVYEIHFVVTWNLEAHLTVVKEEYERKRAVQGVYKVVYLKSDTIILDIPDKGITSMGWEITLLENPELTKKQVDNFREGKVTPCCQLKAKVSGRRKKNIPPLTYRVFLKGTKNPSDFLAIDLPVQDLSFPKRSPTFGNLAITESATGPPPNRKPRLEHNDTVQSMSDDTASASGQMSSAESAKPELKDLLTELDPRLASDWEYIGIQLGIDDGKLKQIKSDNAGDSKACLCEMLRAWLKRVHPPPSWSAIAEALDALGHQHAAEQLRTKYCGRD